MSSDDKKLNEIRAAIIVSHFDGPTFLQLLDGGTCCHSSRLQSSYPINVGSIEAALYA